jgi:hypothetical protein
MKRIFLFFLGAITLCASCKKEEPTAVVTYKVSETTTSVPAFTVSYSAENSTKTEGPIMASSWSSPGVQVHNELPVPVPPSSVKVT